MSDHESEPTPQSAQSPQTEYTALAVTERFMFGHNLEWWNEAMLLSLGITALCAIAVAVTTTAVVKLQRQGEADAKAALEAYKATVNAQVAEANKAGVEAGRAAGGAILQAAQANERAATIEKEAAQLRLALDHEIAQRQPRTITPEQRLLLIQLLTPIPVEKDMVLFNPLMTDGEALAFSGQIEEVLKASGFQVADVPMGDKLFAFNRLGAFLQYRDQNDIPKRATFIAEAFKRIGIQFIGLPDASVKDTNQLVIVIGTHP